ncbi:unnamed protein product, partial [Adineta steineri]
DVPSNQKGDFKPDSKTGVNFPPSDKNAVIDIPLGKPVPVRGIAIRRDTPEGNVVQFKATLYGTDDKPIHTQPLESTPSGNKNQPASVNPSQLPSDVPVKRIEITDIKTSDNQPPKGVVLDVKACTEATSGTTGVSGAGAGTTGVSGSTSASGSTTVVASGTTTKQCQEMEAIDDSVSHNIIVHPEDVPSNKKGDFRPDSKTGVNFPPSDKNAVIDIPLGKPAPVRGIAIRRDTPEGNVVQFKATLYGTDDKPINPQPLESTPSSDKNQPASVNPSQLPSNVPVKRIEITDIKTSDNQPPKGVVLDVKACTESAAGTTGVSGASAGTTPVVGSTSASGSTTVAASGTTTKQCQEMEAIDDSVSKNIRVIPNDVSSDKKGDFKPDSKTGVSFLETDKHPVIEVPLGKPATVQGVSVPRTTPTGNVQQFQVTFLDSDKKAINQQPINSSSSPKGDNKPPTVTSSQIPTNKLVSYVVITIQNTTDNQSPKGVVLDIKACTEATAGTTGVSGAGVGTTGVSGSTSASGSTTVAASGTTTKQCQEMEAVDDSVSHNIIVHPEDVPSNQKGDFKPDSKTGVNFPPSDKNAVIDIPLGKPVPVRGI